jgi:multiple sugar transport system substrate-binding protein
VIRLRGMTWDHPRGINPLVACSDQIARERGIRVDWDARSLEAFEAFPLDQLAAEYDLMIIDHPHVGMAAASGCLSPFDSSIASALNGSTVGASHESYFWEGKQWALAIDAAAQVAAWKGVDVVPQTWAEVVALARRGVVRWPLAPVHALMSFFTRCASAGVSWSDPAGGARVLVELRELAGLVPVRCFDQNPIAVYEEMVASKSPTYVPMTYGYVTYAGRCEFGNLVDDARGSTLGGTGIAVSAKSANADAAAWVATRIASADMQKGTYAAAGGQPAHVAAWENDAVNARTVGFFRHTRLTLDRVFLRPRFDGYIAFQADAGQIVASALRGRMKAEQAMEQIGAIAGRLK